MKFVGGIPGKTKKILATAVNNLPAMTQILGSGNFTSESILSANGYSGKILSNDVSLYSCALGFYLTGKDFSLQLRDGAPEELKIFSKKLDNLENKVAAILFLYQLSDLATKNHQNAKRLYQAHLARAEGQIEVIKEKLRKKKQTTRVDSFYAQCAFKRIDETADDVAFLSFMPTYKGGYERLYKFLDSLFLWEKPAYTIFSQQLDFYKKMTQGGNPFIVFTDYIDDGLKEVLGEPVSSVSQALKREVFLFSNIIGKPHYYRRRVSSAPCFYRRIGVDEEIDPKMNLEIHKIGTKQAMYLKEIYLSMSIQPASTSINYVVTIDGKIIGIVSFSDDRTSKSNWSLPIEGESAYMLTDITLPNVRHSKLSKLVLMACLSNEMKALLDRKYLNDIRVVVTTAFSVNPVSMKYRGLFKIHTRKSRLGIGNKEEFAINYFAPAGQYSLKEALSRWFQKYQK